MCIRDRFFIHPADGSLFAMAGLYEFWRDQASAAAAPWLVTTTIITTAASGALAEIHDRRPVGLLPEVWDVWLDPAVGVDEAVPLLADAGPAMVAEPVSTAVNRVGMNGPELIERIAGVTPR